MANLLRVFVYGTLKPGEYYYDRYCAAKVVEAQAAFAYGQLFDLPLGYPAMTMGNFRVYGFVLSFADPDVLQELDELEDYAIDRPADQNEYVRVETETFSPDHQPLGSAWVYLMNLEQAKRSGGVLLPDGCWTSSKSNS